MKILHVVQGYTPAIGGTERVIQKVSENLVARHGDDVTVFTTTAYNLELFWRRDQPELSAGETIIDGVRVRRFRVFNRLNKLRWLLAGGGYKASLPYNDWLRALYNGPLIPAMPGEIARSGADVVAASSFPLLHMHYAQWGARRARRPVVFFGGIHSADDFGFNRPMIYRAIRGADAYIAYTSFERDYLVAEKGIRPSKIGVVGVGVDLEPFAQADGRKLRERLGWGDAPVVAFVGQQVPHKGLDMVLAAMQPVWQSRPDACLLIAGARTTYSATVRAQIEALPPDLHDRVAVLDNFGESEKAGIFAACDLLAFPSGHESFGIVFLEAWAARKPVIGARIGAIPTVVSDGVDGLLITHRDTTELIQAIETLLADPALRQRLGEAGYRKVTTHYTWDIVADKVRAVYAAVIERRKQDRSAT
jgi:glycosyltransferase involved in cell wall biosynthesis